MTTKEFIEKIKSKVLKLSKKYNILSSLMMAQACHESGFGKHAPGNNLFGYKWTKTCGYEYQLLWTKEYINGQYISIQAKFRKYNSLDDSLEDYAKLIGTSKRYAPVRECKDYICACKQVKACGYATGKTYDQSLINLINQYKFYELDEKKDFNIGDDDMKLYILKKGVKGNFVKWLQEILEVEYGFENEYSGGWDGDFGSLTEKQVEAYQKDNDLPINGMIEMEEVINLINKSEDPDYWMRKLQIYMGFE